MAAFSNVDVPLVDGSDDLLGLKAYQEALSRFIKNSDTPITIALQGEWGSGKTTLMNALRRDLCTGYNAPFCAIEVNTWHYALMHSPELALVGIMEALVSQIGVQVYGKLAVVKDKVSALCRRFAVIGAKVAAKQVGADISPLLVNQAPNLNSEVLQLKAELAKLINASLEQHSYRGFVIFIDDLDRIDPKLAVDTLEMLKNVFDLKHCIFVLALDFEVVIKGLEPKFGVHTAANDRQFRAFFDKFVQLPFTMPLPTYKIDGFLQQALLTNAFLSPAEGADEQLIAQLSSIAYWSVGSNPRALKRLANSLALFALINSPQLQPTQPENAAAHELFTKQLIFALVCIQIAYPSIFDLLLEVPDFKSWDSTFAQLRKAPEIASELVPWLKQEFPDEWAQVLFRICQNDAYLQQNFDYILLLLNQIAAIIKDDVILGESIAWGLALLRVTSVTSSNRDGLGSKHPKRKVTNDDSAYDYAGKVYTSDQKSELLYTLCRDYQKAHPKLSRAEFIQKVNPPWGPTIVMTVEEYQQLGKRSETFHQDLDESDSNITLSFADGKVFTASYVRKRDMAWVFQHFTRIGLSDLTMHCAEDDNVYSYHGVHYGPTQGQFFATCNNLLFQLATDFISANSQQTGAEMITKLNLYPDAHRFVLYQEELRAELHLDDEERWRNDLPQLNDGSRILMSRKILEREFEEYLKRFRKMGYQVELVQKGS